MPEYKIIKTLVSLEKRNRKFHKELNLIQWADHPPKWDFRGWDDRHEEMTEGITMTDEELQELKIKLTEVRI